MFGGWIEILMLTLSYPIRLMSTGLSVGILRTFGFDVTANLTLITVAGRESGIAVTDACGGIDQLTGLLVVGIVLSVVMQRKWRWRLMHFACILPALVLANALRLVLTIVLLSQFGDVVLANTCHHALGWLQVVLVVVFIWLFGKLIRFAAH